MIHSSWPWRKGLRSACAGMLLAGITTATCWSQQATVNTEQALASWLNCEYCEHGELEAIARGGEAIVPSLVTALHDGPSPVAREICARSWRLAMSNSSRRARRTQLHRSPRPRRSSSGSIWAISRPSSACARRRHWR